MKKINLDLNKKNKEEIEKWVAEFHSIYKLDSSFHTQSNEEFYLGDKNNKVCRFCNKDKTQTSFKKIAHVVPSFMGNINVKSDYECDKCNELFAKYETDLASFIGLRRFYEPIGTHDKKKRRVFKLPNSEAEVYATERGTELYDPRNEIFEELDGGNTVKCKINKSPYVPLNVYKALIKIVISPLRKEVIKDYKKTLAFLQDESLDNYDVINKFGKLSILSFGDFYMKYPIIYVYKKLPQLWEYEERQKIIFPDKTFIIYFMQFCYQIFLPYDINDNNIYKKRNIILSLFPPILTEPNDTTKKILYLDYYHELRDISVKKKVKDEKDEFYIINSFKPFTVEYTDEEHEILKKKYGLRR